jgi:hypothetical protein
MEPAEQAHTAAQKHWHEMELYRLQQSQAKAFARDGGPLRQHAVAQPAPQPELEELLPKRGVVVLRAACTGAFHFRPERVLAPPS